MSGRGPCGLRRLFVMVVGGLVVEAADLAVPEAVVAEGEELAGDRDFPILRPTAFGDLFVLGTQASAAGGGVLRGLGQRTAQDRGATSVGMCPTRASPSELWTVGVSPAQA